MYRHRRAAEETYAELLQRMPPEEAYAEEFPLTHKAITGVRSALDEMAREQAETRPPPPPLSEREVIRIGRSRSASPGSTNREPGDDASSGSTNGEPGDDASLGSTSGEPEDDAASPDGLPECPEEELVPDGDRLLETDTVKPSAELTDDSKYSCS